MPSGERQQVEFLLECIECGERNDRGLGWRAYLDVDDDVWIYCVDCSRRELGDEDGS